MATLQNKTVVVVGGSSGIGFSVALAALQAFASVVIVASSNAERVAQAVERLKAHKLPGEVRGDVLDARDPTSVKDFSLRIGTVDHVAWSSGDVPKGLLDTSAPDAQALNGTFSVRFWGPYILAQHAKFNPGGSLTLTGGTLDIKPSPGLSHTSGMCSALEGLTKGLAVDLAPVRVNLVAPGAIDTELWKDTFLKAVETKQIIKRFGLPDECAEAYIFLMKCGYITGQRITVDGGIALV